MNFKSISIALFLISISISVRAAAQAPDPALMAEIHKIRAIDNHSHPPRVVENGETDDEFDALPCDPLEPTEPNTMTRPENPQYLAAWKALWGYEYTDRSDAHVKELIAKKNNIRQEQGDHYPAWVLDQLGIDIEFANRVAMGRGLDAKHFRWVPFDDALLFPLNNDALAAETPDRKFFFGRENMLLARYRRELGVASMPPSLAEYTSRVITPELERQKNTGAVAIKFEAAYLRSLDFEPASERDAAAIYAKYLHGGVPVKEDYTRLQDYLFRYVAAEAGRLGLPVHIHTGAGCGGYFFLSGSHPLLLESVLNDARLRKTTFVLLHGGSGPFTGEIAPLLMKPNVYADLSEQTWMESPHRLAEVLREWMEWYPEKILFGTDLYPGSGAYDWEEIGWQTSQTGRQALGMALTEMLHSGEITVLRANEIARMVLRENAIKLYHLQDAQ
ncbi:MAG TPA: amidohydrolase family protein [Candidatus Acidoferrales bacterium]|jgi:predicted TIM-barrel fold metal-dependent hydrolase|nr:amidohydrolase family protein [Candidatus Acidoferrales bacterium]